ncbi:MAG: glucuronate isomerase, partial [Ruminococcaceae bacterium]|nr:glucuronate isomerase [Oscillospiraceae bacterium]
MSTFFNKKVLLHSEEACKLYEQVSSLPIVDYHCHLNPAMIAEDAAFGDIGEFWLSGDHYKWRAMRMCGVDERYITGDASFHDKFIKYAEILPQLIGNPLYYWTHMELSQIFDIHEPLCAESAERIYEEASEKLSSLSVHKLLHLFGVEIICTTDDPVDSLCHHGKHGGV